jgi:phage N-6-adenine-methyltransferase
MRRKKMKQEATLKQINPLGNKKNDSWVTPPEVFNYFNKEFRFTLDVCADEKNHLVSPWMGYYGDTFINGLIESWRGEVCWMNPPYSKLGTWVKKAYEESRKEDTIVVCLIPANFDTKWFLEYGSKAEVRILMGGRIQFLDTVGAHVSGNTRGSMVLVFGKNIKPSIKLVNLKEIISAS